MEKKKPGTHVSFIAHTHAYLKRHNLIASRELLEKHRLAIISSYLLDHHPFDPATDQLFGNMGIEVSSS